MVIGAVITAAGMSSRMGEFKQLMKINGHSVIEYSVMNFEKAGVDKIVVVTGYRQKDVEDELRVYNNITFVNNNRYETTQMFDSIKLGIMAIKDSVDRILITPCDAVEYNPSIVEKLINMDKPLVLPAYKGATGHPICISASLAEAILRYDGLDGLRGAINSLDIEPWLIEADNAGILRDLDTIDDFERIKKLDEW